MTASLTSVGVQSFSITIASGATTGTASISAVGSGAVMNWQGSTCTETSAQNNDTQASLTISGTTITATRGATGTSQSMVVNGTITDFDTTNAAKSVQTGTISITTTSTTGTATISAVTNTNTGVFYLGESSATSLTSIDSFFSTLSLSGTTLTAQRSTGTSATITVAYCIFEARGTALNSSTQQVTHTNATSGTNNTATITSVTTANTMVCYAGERYNSSSTPSLDFTNIQLTAATTLTYTWDATGVLPGVSVVTVMEFVAAMLAQNVQRGTLALSAATSNTATITSSPTAQTLLNWLFHTSTASTFNPATTNYKITQTNATTITLTVNTSASGTGSYEAINFNPAAANTGTVTGTVTETDSASVIANDNTVLTETATETDSSSASATGAASIAESQTTSDSYNSLVVFAFSVNESVTSSDSVAGAATGLTNLNETGNVSDQHLGIASDSLSLSENITESDVYSASNPAGNSVTESVTESDSEVILASVIGSLTETIAANDNYNSILIPAGGVVIAIQTGSGAESRRKKYLEWLAKKKKKEFKHRAESLGIAPSRARQIAETAAFVAGKAKISLFDQESESQTNIDQQRILQLYEDVWQQMAVQRQEIYAIKEEVQRITDEEDEEEFILMMM